MDSIECFSVGAASGCASAFSPKKADAAPSNSPDGRIVAFDLMEVCAIFMACSLHYPLFARGSFIAELWQLLCMGAVPAFFMINGYLLFSKPLDLCKHIRKIANVALGIFLWKLLILLLFSFLGLFDTGLINPASLAQYFLTAATLGNLPAAPIWFMYALLSIYIVFPIFKIVYDAGHKTILLIIVALGILFIPAATDLDWLFYAVGKLSAGALTVDLRIAPELADFFPFGPWGMYLVFFLLGPLIWPSTVKASERFGRLRLGLLSIALLSCFIMIALLQDYVYQGSFTWTGNVIPNQYKHIVTLGITVSLLALSASIALPRCLLQTVTLISCNTITIFYVHAPILLLLAHFSSWPQGFAASCVRTLVVVLFGAALGFALKKIPFIRRIA